MQNQMLPDRLPVLPARGAALERPRISRLLEESLQNPVSLVAANAGYGKTQAVCAFLRSQDARVIWTSCSVSDNKIPEFWKNHASKLALTDKTLAGPLAKDGFPETERGFERYKTLLHGAIRPGERRIFVYDDVHLIREAEILQFIERVAEARIPGVSQIIISRDASAVSRFRRFASEFPTCMDERALRFTKEETASYFGLLGLRPGPQLLSGIQNSADGWIFAIQAAALAMRRGEFRETQILSAMKTNVFKWIESEIFSAVPAKTQNLLIRLSLLTRLFPELLAELSGDVPLLEIPRVASFIRYDAQWNAYRFHELFRACLTQKQGCLTTQEKRGIYLKAARWCAENQYKTDAIAYYEKAEDYKGILDVAYSLPLLMPNETAIALLALTERAPKDGEGKVLTHILRPRLLINLARFREAAAEIYGNMKKFEAAPGAPSAFACRVFAANCNYLGMLRMLTCMYTKDYGFESDFERGYHYLKMGGFRYEGPMSLISVPPYVAQVGGAEKGEISCYIEALSRGISYLENSMSGCMRGMEDLARAEFAFFKNELKDCEKHARRALSEAREKRQYEIESRALFFLLRISLGTGNALLSADVLAQLERKREAKDSVNRRINHDMATGWFFAAIRREDRIAAWLKDDFGSGGLNPLLQGLESLARVKFCLSAGKYLQALALLASQENAYGTGGLLYGKIEMKVAEAAARYHLKEKDAALEALRSAYDLAAPNGLTMPFIEMGREMRTLAGAALKAGDCGIPRAWLEKIRSKASTYAKRIAQVAAAYSPRGGEENGVGLTAREREILADLYHGLSRSEIAASRNMSVNTVKAALQLIYEKLGAENAVDAVRIAASGRFL
ncbi:MAG: LuxR C-terminal-related transcriptional regulator [Clostridiales Family XIII bacterium]|jgi:LuxR family maltose regulon positive regulatory protein|nr:LuxR C-terminal-related transcriptional regulator [Clostridiales Family XIII bacterium]